MSDKADQAQADARKATARRIGIAAAVVLAPGGFVLGATLAARYFAKRRAEKREAESADKA